VRAWLRAPLLHFLLGGALLFRAVYGPAPFAAVGRGGDSPPIVLTAADVERLRTDYTRETGLVPTADDEAALINQTIDEELLFREALARGLDHDRSVRMWLIEQMQVLTDARSTDPDALYDQALALDLHRTDLVVRRILVQKMRLLAARANEQPPAEAALRSYYAAHAPDYTPPTRVTLWHVFLASATYGSRADEEARALLATLTQQRTLPTDAVRHADSFSVPAHLIGQSPAQLEKLFGPTFAAALADTPVHTWAGPIASAYGVHLVWIEAREPATPPPFDSVRGRVRERYQDELRRERVQALLRDLARRHPLQIASTAWRPRSRP
jgi:PPIC-type PPIASE domain